MSDERDIEVIAFIEDGALWIGEAGEFGLAAIEDYRAKHGVAPRLLTPEEIKRLTTP